MEINEAIGYTQCSCGEKFQVLKEANEEGIVERDNRETDILYYTHIVGCQHIETLLWFNNCMVGLNAEDRISEEVQAEINNAKAVRGILPVDTESYK